MDNYGIHHDAHLKCGQCGWQGPESWLEIECIDYGSLYDPPEYTCRCPSCGLDWELMEEIDVE